MYVALDKSICSTNNALDGSPTQVEAESQEPKVKVKTAGTYLLQLSDDKLQLA